MVYSVCSDLITEKQNPHSIDIDKLSTLEILELINKEDSIISSAVQKVIPELEKVVEFTATALKNGNRIIYIGAGTSGRLGILDASEIPPTFSAPREWFTGVIAGGTEAVFRSIESAEDIPDDAITDLNAIDIKKGDVLIGIASSGTTPYVIAGLKYGKQIGCHTVFLVSNPNPVESENYDVVISVDLGPEIITGSTRMKAGTATKLILNMISTTTMIKMGKVYGNLMVDLQVVNEKLRDRGTRIIEKLTNLNYKEAGKALIDSGGSVKTALIMVNKSCSKTEAEKLYNKYDGNLRNIIGDVSI
jgi:N-acetylmuramic acid 6-phosphate etherase